MVFHRVRGHGGVYEYFGCLSHQWRRGNCGARHLQTDHVEKAVERYYSTIRLSASQQQVVRKAVEEHAGALMVTAQRESERHARHLQELQQQQQQQKLLHLFYKGSVAEEVLAAEQGRIEAERSETHTAGPRQPPTTPARSRKRLRGPWRCSKTHRSPTRRPRRMCGGLLNQALFDGLLVRDEDITDANPKPWVTEIHRLANAPKGPQKGRKHPDGGEDDHGPLSGAVGFK